MYIQHVSGKFLPVDLGDHQRRRQTLLLDIMGGYSAQYMSLAYHNR